MYNLIDLVQLQTNKKREEIEEILTAAIEITKEQLQEGNDVYWIGLCRFTWKQKAKTKKAAKEWTEYPYLAESEKIRCIPIPGLEEINARGKVLKIPRRPCPYCGDKKVVSNEQIQVVETQAL